MDVFENFLGAKIASIRKTDFYHLADDQAEGLVERVDHFLLAAASDEF